MESRRTCFARQQLQYPSLGTGCAPLLQSTQPSTLRGTVKWATAYAMSNNNKWWMWKVAACRKVSLPLVLRLELDRCLFIRRLSVIGINKKLRYCRRTARRAILANSCYGTFKHWRNFGLKSDGDQAKFMTWCTYKVGVRPPTPKKWGSGPLPLKLRLCL